MPGISNVVALGDLKSATLRERAERGHCSRSREFLASVNGEEAGLLSYEDWSDGRAGFIYEIFVLPSFRRQGIGQSLLSYAERYAIQLGCKLVRLKPYALDQEPDQSRLIAWYTRAGYLQTANDQEHMEKLLRVQGAA